MTLAFKLLSETVAPPVRRNSIYYELFSAYEIAIPAWTRKPIPTDVALQMPAGCYGRLVVPPELADRILVGAGIIDRDFTGNIMAIFQNISNETVHIKSGQPLVRLICQKILEAEAEVVYTLHSDRATPPQRMTSEAAGCDLFSAQNATIAPWQSGTVSTDVSVRVPAGGYYARLAVRSGTCAKNGIFLSNDVVMNDEIIQLNLINLTDTSFKIERGDRLVQLICEKIFCGSCVEEEAGRAFRTTERNERGFGSTGKN